MFTVEFTIEAQEDMREFKAYESRRLIEAIEKQLLHQPTQETRNRKCLRPNQLAEWELRIERFRVFYDVDEQEQRVKIEAVGYKKGSQLFIHGEKYQI